MKSPEPRYSGTSQATTVSTPQVATSRRVRGSVHISQSP
jgi:hypothetical protein